MRTVFLSLAAALAAALLVAAPAEAAACPTGWGSTVKTAAGLSSAAISGVRDGHDACWDRVVFDVAGAPGGFRAEYVPQVTADGSGLPVTVPGGARIQLVIDDPQTAPPPVGTSLVDTAGLSTVRSVIEAGSFEGETTVGVGTRARLPFRVFTLPPAPGVPGRIVLDVARSW